MVLNSNKESDKSYQKTMLTNRLKFTHGLSCQVFCFDPNSLKRAFL